MILPSPVVVAMEIMINRSLRLDESSLRRIIELQGKVIGFELKGLDTKFYLAPASDGVQVFAEFEDPIDTWIRGTPISLLKTALSGDRKSLFQGEVVIEGNMELGQKFQRILENLDLDWEEPLSQLFGDVAANQIGQFIRGFTSWAKTTADSFTRSTAEYYTEESRDVVSETEVSRFVDDVDEVRAAVERMELRINKFCAKTEEQKL